VRDVTDDEACVHRGRSGMGWAVCGTAPSRACVSWTIGAFPMRTRRWPRSPHWHLPFWEH